MKKILLALTAAIYLTAAHAQPTFQKAFGGSKQDYAISIEKSDSNSLIISGHTNSYGQGDWDFFLRKFDAKANPVWTKVYGTPQAETGYCAKQTLDSGFIFIGTAANDVLLLKTNSSGDTIWTKRYGGAKPDFGYTVLQTADSGYVFAGQTQSYGAGFNDAYVVKANSKGNITWSKTFGGTLNDSFNDIQTTKDGGYIAAGATGSFGSGSTDVYVVKLSATGDTLWTKVIGGTGEEYGYSVKNTSDGGYMIAGTSDGGTGQSDFLLIKLNSAGVIQWRKTYGTTAFESFGNGQRIIETVTGDFLFCGTTNKSGSDKICVVKVNSSGVLSWAKSFDATTESSSFSIEQLPSGNFAVCGIAYINGVADAILIKIDAGGSSGCFQSNLTFTTGSPTISVRQGGQINSGLALAKQLPVVVSTVTFKDSTFCFIPTGMNDGMASDQITIYPNPFSTQTVLQTDHFFRNATLTIHNSLGQTVGEPMNVNGQFITIQREQLSKGLYFIRVVEGDTVYVKKAVIED